MKMKIISSGPLTTVQDEGRFGYMQFGFSPSGAMDTYSMKLANILVGNPANEGVLEMTLKGITAEFDCDAVIAITGADMKPKIGNTQVPMYKSIQVKKGDVLQFGIAQSGMRTYLAVCYGFDIPVVMGSMSTNLKCGIGGFCGRKLKNEDVLNLRYQSSLDLVGHRSVNHKPSFPSEITVRAVLGPQDDYFTAEGINTFFSTVYTVSDKSDRMGIRLDGSKIESKNGVDIISDAVVTGSIQIPASGVPIIMMADRQTTGGYAKIASVITPDLQKIAQARPGTQVRFAKVTAQQAQKIYKQYQKQLNIIEYSTFFDR